MYTYVTFAFPFVMTKWYAFHYSLQKIGVVALLVVVLICVAIITAFAGECQ